MNPDDLGAGGLPVTTPAFTVNRLCGSGLQAIVSAAQAIRLGDAEAAVAGGAESMSRGQYWLPGLRWGQRMQDGVTVDAMVGALTDPFGGCHMGVTAENVAAEFGISREDQDALAAESHRRAAAAAQVGHFAEQITPVQAPTRKGTVEVTADEHIRPDATADAMARLPPAFADSGTVTAGTPQASTTRQPLSCSPAVATPRVKAWRRLGAWSATATPASSRGSWGSARYRPSGRCLTGSA